MASRGSPIVGGFVALPNIILDSLEFAALSGRAVKLLLAVARQYRRPSANRAGNNGDLTITRAAMAARGFKSADQLQKARDELVATGWIMVTRQGGRHVPSLYALTWEPIDRCGGKLEVAHDTMPRHLWKAGNAHLRETPTRKSLTRSADKVGPQHGASLTRSAGQGSQH